MAVLPAAVFLGSVPVAYQVSPAAAQRCWFVLVVAAPLASRLAGRAAPTAGSDAAERDAP
jgi:hypothetical protein